MCHSGRLESLSLPGEYVRKKVAGISYLEYVPENEISEKPIMVLTDIYGCNDFYQGFATHLTMTGRRIHLVDLFSELGELDEVTREAAFKRRHLLHDRQVCDKLQNYISFQSVGSVVGFCLGANYVLEMARRNIKVNLVGYYPFPAGLPNQDELEKPLSYLDSIKVPVTILVGDADDSAGRDNMFKLSQIGDENPSLDVHVYRQSGHGFLSDLDDEDDQLRKNAIDSLDVCMEVVSR